MATNLERATNAAKYARGAWEKVFPGDQLPSMLELMFFDGDRRDYIAGELKDASCFLQGVAYVLSDLDKRQALWSAVEVLDLAVETVVEGEIHE